MLSLYQSTLIFLITFTPPITYYQSSTEAHLSNNHTFSSNTVIRAHQINLNTLPHTIVHAAALLLALRHLFDLVLSTGKLDVEFALYIALYALLGAPGVRISLMMSVGAFLLGGSVEDVLSGRKGPGPPVRHYNHHYYNHNHHYAQPVRGRW